MKMNKKDQRELHAMLDEALDRVLKGEDINIILADYPRFASEFAPLLRTAGDTRKAVDIKPRPEFRQRAALDFQKAIQAMPVKAGGNKYTSRWRMAWIMPVAVFVAVLISGTGIVAASNNSLPGSPLYSVKLATENVQLAFTPSNIGKAELYAKFNDRRVDELVTIAAKTDAVELVADIDTLNTRIASNMAEISQLTGGANTAATSGSMSMMAATEQSKGIIGLNDNSTAATTTPLASTTATVTRTATSTMTTTVATTRTATSTAVTPDTTNSQLPNLTTSTTTTQQGVPATSTTATTIPPAGSTTIIPPATESVSPERAYGPGNETHSALTDEEQKLVTLLTEKQQENLEKLEAAWEKAPDWLKPLIRQAIDLILYGYDTSISNLSD
jgi:hypothetical protein